MLNQQLVLKHQSFFDRLHGAVNAKAVRDIVKSASHSEKRALILLIATVALQKVSVPAQVAEAFGKTRKKRVLKKYFSAKTKVKTLLRNKDIWNDVLTEITPVIKPSVSVFF